MNRSISYGQKPIEIKRVLLAEAQNRRLHSTFGWVSMTFTLVIRVKFTFILDWAFSCPLIHQCSKLPPLPREEANMCWQRYGWQTHTAWMKATKRTGKKKQKNKQQQEKISVTSVHTLGDCELRGLLIETLHSSYLWKQDPGVFCRHFSSWGVCSRHQIINSAATRAALASITNMVDFGTPPRL